MRAGAHQCALARPAMTRILIIPVMSINNISRLSKLPDVTENDVKAELQNIYLACRKERLNRKRKHEVPKLDTAKFIEEIINFLYLDYHI